MSSPSVRRRLGLLLHGVVASLVATLVACGGGGGDAGEAMAPTPVLPTTFTVGGTVSGLSGSGLVLQNNGSDDIRIAADGSFGFPTALANGQAYAVTVRTAPQAPRRASAAASVQAAAAAALP